MRSVRMRRHLRSGDFKGSVFVEFDSEDLAKEVRGRAHMGIASGHQSLVALQAGLNCAAYWNRAQLSDRSS